MRRSLFPTFFLLVLVAFVLFALAAVHIANQVLLPVLLGGAVLMASAIAVAMQRIVSKALAPLQSLAERIPHHAVALEELELQRYEEFDGVAWAIARASTKSLAALDEVQAERRELEALLDSMQDAVVAVDASGRIQWANQKMQRLVASVNAGGTGETGASGAGAANAVRVGHALVQTARDPDVLACVKTALDERIVGERRTTTLLPGRIFEVSASPMPAGGAVAVLHDITRIEQIERTQRDFVANVSHELRTPLTSISGYVETLLDHESLSPMAQEFLSTILKNTTRMNRLTEDLLTMTRVESSEAVLHPRAVRADALVQDAVEAMNGLVQDVAVELEIGDTCATEVVVDVDAMTQVLANLIENGIKYGRSKGAERSRVVVGARDVTSAGIGAVEFSVRDFGAGIASEHLTRIFERFYRVDKARSRESGGTGLGLAIARHMVEMQGGTIYAESELGAGSNFVVRLPREHVV
jgi:two-component system phosphate regulon sensor histidine kinase PhoR